MTHLRLAPSPSSSSMRRVSPRRQIPLAVRLWRKTDTTGEHWIWQGHVNKKTGYGQIGRGTHEEGIASTHRVAWELTYGSIPEGLFVCHTCDIRVCIRPDHLFLGTARDNSLDMMSKERNVTYRSVAHPSHKLTDDEVREIKQLVTDGHKQTHVARRFGVSSQHVGQLVSGKSRSYVKMEN